MLPIDLSLILNVSAPPLTPARRNQRSQCRSRGTHGYCTTVTSGVVAVNKSCITVSKGQED